MYTGRETLDKFEHQFSKKLIKLHVLGSVQKIKQIQLPQAENSHLIQPVCCVKTAI